METIRREESASDSAGEDVTMLSAQDQQRRDVLATWLSDPKNTRELLAYLRPISRRAEDVRGQTPAETVSELLTASVAGALANAGRFNSEQVHPRAWIAGFARNIVSRWLQEHSIERQRRAHLIPPDGPEGGPTAEWHDRLQGAAGQTLGNESADQAALGPLWVEQVLSQLPSQHSRMLRLRLIDDLSFDDIAVILSAAEGKIITAGTARVRYHRALEIVRGNMKRDEARALGTGEMAVPPQDTRNVYSGLGGAV